MKDYKSGVKGDSEMYLKLYQHWLIKSNFINPQNEATVVKHIQIHRNKILNHFLTWGTVTRNRELHVWGIAKCSKHSHELQKMRNAQKI